jgi:hypothetical protein
MIAFNVDTAVWPDNGVREVDKGKPIVCYGFKRELTGVNCI